jgi:protein TorT
MRIVPRSASAFARPLMMAGALSTVPIPVSNSPRSAWYPFPVEVPVEPRDPGVHEKGTVYYEPLQKADRKWSVCVSFPHLKDSYWLAVNFGMSSEAARMGVRLRLHQAGGYDNLPVQIEQIRQCAREGADGVIIGAISYRGLDGLVSELGSRGVPVIDLINGMSSERVSARSLVSFEEMGFRAGEYIARQHPPGSRPAKVAWFPGPQGAGWVEAGDAGFHRALEGSAAQIVATRYGDTGKAAQTKLLEDVLDTHPDIDYVAGTAVTAVAAVRTLRLRGMSQRTKVMSYYFTPEVYREIKRGRVMAAPTDSAVIQGRVAVDQLVRILEHKPYMKQVGPHIYIIDGANVDTFDRSTSLAPDGFRATYTVNVRTESD